MYSFPDLEPDCPVLTVLPDLHTGFSRGRSGGLVIPSLSEFSTVYCDPHSQRLGIVNKAEIDVLELSYFFDDPVDVANLICCSSAFSKTSLNILNFMVHVLLKPGLENFEHYFTSMWDECNCVVVWTFFGIAFLWDWNKTDLFQSCGHCWVFQICWRIKYSTFITSSFRIWNSSTGIPSPPLVLFFMMFPRAHLTPYIPGCLALGEWSHFVIIWVMKMFSIYISTAPNEYI